MQQILFATALCVVVGLAPAARAQAPAAFADGKKAYEAGQFAKARDLLLSAARTAQQFHAATAQLRSTADPIDRVFIQLLRFQRLRFWAP